ncbi:hypothetical protein FNJ62_13590 [Streptomyces benahoarensis]|uniref:Integral membrane protein n=1 Tax=Streptomyces benahoarensis TaxID=2595054 RepID=A0A553ZMY3_9ACTN|nr:hypothetical protein FNJ62_13590 [Streptomyces benahoarensis]TSB42800.1 hypothetical protein FNZ23_07950 [Streptomyces benahoarensis]
MAEFWLMPVTAVLITVGAPAVGVVAAHAVQARDPLTRGTHSVRAVLTEDPPARIGVDAATAAGARARATVRWTAPDGSVRHGRVAVPAGARAGAHTTARLDRSGHLLRDAADPSRAQAEGVAVGMVAASSGALLLLGAARGARLLLDRRRDTQWERAWERVGPDWGGAPD